MLSRAGSDGGKGWRRPGGGRRWRGGGGAAPCGQDFEQEDHRFSAAGTGAGGSGWGGGGFFRRGGGRRPRGVPGNDLSFGLCGGMTEAVMGCSELILASRWLLRTVPPPAPILPPPPFRSQRAALRSR
jgi:hypothetical protein